MNIKDLFDYNWYSRRKMLESMAGLPWEKVVESCGASFDSIRDIFVHCLQSEDFWISLLNGKSTEGIFETPFDKFASIDALREYSEEVEAASAEYLRTLTSEKLESVFEFKLWEGKPRRNKTEDILMHVVEEQIHHRGELLCICWQNDIKPPYTNYMVYVDHKSQV